MNAYTAVFCTLPVTFCIPLIPLWFWGQRSIETQHRPHRPTVWRFIQDH